MKNRRIVVNITLSLAWRRRPVGIVRVERELVNSIVKYSSSPIIPVTYSQSTGWKVVPVDLFKKCMQDSWVSTLTSFSEESDIGLITMKKFEPNNDDIFFSVGSDWSYNLPQLVGDLYSDQKNLISICYDLIPIKFPEYTPDAGFYDQFITHYKAILSRSNKIIAISDNSALDLEQHWLSQGETVDTIPEIKTIPLAGIDSSIYPENLTETEQEFIDGLCIRSGFVIYVCTLEPRKNHALLVSIWKELFIKHGESCPTLLFVGMRGWGCNSLLNMLSKMDVVKAEKIIWKEGVSDTLLKSLYANSLFAVYPSAYEGWGLAVTEAMSFGKVCVVSNNSSLQQASQNLMPAYHFQDYPSWMSEIERLVFDTEYRNSLENEIKLKYIPRSWDNVGEELVQWLED